MKYKTIYADPPWKRGQVGGGKICRGVQKHYDLMSNSQIIEYMRGAGVGPDAHMYLWTTNTNLTDALEVMAALRFRYVTNLVWVKDRFGLGQYFRGQHELILFGVRGKLPYKENPEPGKSRICAPTVIQAPRREHSRKPDEVYDIIEKVSYPPYLEVFARQRRAGWDVLGNEVDKFTEADDDKEEGKQGDNSRRTPQTKLFS